MSCLLIVVCNVIVDLVSDVFFFQAEDGIRDLVRSRGLGDVYKRQVEDLGKSGAGHWCAYYPQGIGHTAYKFVLHQLNKWVGVWDGEDLQADRPVLVQAQK